MKRLPKEIIEKISDFETESELSLPGFALEKDYFVLDAITLIQALPASPDFRFVFCGGTCLAKAYGILHRMSEDVDFKLVPTEVTAQLPKATLRRRLSAFVKNVITSLEAGGFGKNSITRRSLDSNSYSCLDVEYESAFSKPSSLRPHLLLELNHSTLRAPTETHKVGLLLDKLTSGAYQSPIEIECISLREALAEKLVSFPRRLALQLQKDNTDTVLDPSSGWDKALVRHLYDVHQIIQHAPVAQLDASDLARILSGVIANDAIEFQNQHPQFYLTPLAQLSKALTWAGESENLKIQYDAFVADMVYASPENTPSFAEALDVFSRTLQTTMTLMSSENIAREMAR
ncbi:nucleotidyl transferase AbiEii/AbiGii toxin family protein [Herbaspirillum sp. RTI4]|uniref:nucleotidyl transferase AbiEii/AbiGii toxin family protein n=1 Tax=Herbaspirillum sp. RTI4 TaxID=3048640 RepID=UPI002AB39D2F|nr:nucleotidyl transferase AbiEii/AbiGii toxin family protein [Herbaspirillum sp. RTI4]MDY7576728.1 nucleotidyl transferase AbiEii/AbiGii toxin family protein [Herbaspirillum sp. RTI4]MEA9983599.1 nucleotidyl transferase AbiEii/AbiGii toxin family protein [Herbaspirillum sp. RTI4]